MKVKIGNTIHDSEKEPIMLILSSRDKGLISNMAPKMTKYCSYPDTDEWTRNNCKAVKKWMEIPLENEKI